MKQLIGFVAVFAVTVLFQGCGGPKERVVIDTPKTLYVNMEKSAAGFKLKEIVDRGGDIDIRLLQASSPDVIAKFCGEKDAHGCMDKIIDIVEKNINRKALLIRYNALVSANERHIAIMKKDLDEYRPGYEADYKKVGLEYRINDLSRLYKGEKLHNEKIVWVGKNDLNYPSKADHKDEIEKLFPVAYEAFHDKAKALEEAWKKAFSKEEITYKRTIRKRSSYYPLVRAKTMKSGPFSLSVRAPQFVNRNEAGNKRVIINVTGKDVEDIYPHKFEAKNPDIKVVFNQKMTTFVNNRSEDIMLQSLTFFYNGHKEKVLLGDNFSFSLIGPKEQTATDSALFLTEDFAQAANYAKVTRANAKQRQVSFGIELAYRIGNHDKKLKFHKKNPLWRFISGW